MIREKINKLTKINKINKIVIFSIIIIVIYLAVFLIPNQTELLSLNPNQTGFEPWRFLTYQFAHSNTSHLIENIIGIFFVVWIAYELKVTQFMFSLSYLSAGILAILPLWIMKPFIAIGASTAIIAALTVSFFNGVKYKIKPYVLIIILSIVLFAPTIYSIFAKNHLNFNLLSDSAHFTGVLFGIAIYYPLKELYKLKTKKKRTVLQKLKD